MAKRLALIRPSVLIPVLRLTGNPLSAIPPLSIAYLAAAAREAGHSVVCIDATGEAPKQVVALKSDSRIVEIGLTFDEIVAKIPADVDVIGVSCMFSPEWFRNRELIQAIRKSFPDRLIVLGGEHVTAEYEFILRTTPEVDACVLGEGEVRLVELLATLERGESAYVPGIAYRNTAGEVVKNEVDRSRYRVKNLEQLPWPAWDLIPLKNYFDTGFGFGSYGHRPMPMLASRGCPFSCTFCSSPQMWTTQWKARDIDDLINEIKTYIRRYGINRVEFYDLTAVVNKNWIKNFCQRLLDENLGITWSSPVGTRSEALTEDVLELMMASGCNKQNYALESGSKKTSERIRKRINFGHTLSSMRAASRLGFIVKVNMILGFPFHTYRDLFQEIAFTVRLAWIGVNDVVFYNFTPYPGSELHRELVENGTISRNEEYAETLQSFFPGLYTNPSWSPHIPGPVLSVACTAGMFVFYVSQFLFRPTRVFQFAVRLWKRKPVTMLELVMFNAFNRLGWAGRALRRRAPAIS